VRLRLTVLYAAILVASTVLLLGLSWWLMKGHLERTLPASFADDVTGRLLAQYAIALAGVVLLAVGLGWIVAGRALSPIRRITDTARRVSEERLGERIGPLDGPDDEVRALAATLDAMLDRLQGAVEAQKHFVANASHELHSPLTVIRTEVEVTLSDPDADAAALRRMGQIVLEASERSEALLDGLLMLALSQRGAARREPVDLAGVARRVARDVACEAEAAELRVELDTAPAPVHGDPQLLERLVANLVDNAVRHNERGGFVSVTTGLEDDRSVLYVANGGPVIPGDAVARLDQPFQRLARSAERRGSGLGLSIVRSVVEAHGGELRLSGRPQGGLEAEVRLPAGEDAAVPDRLLIHS